MTRTEASYSPGLSPIEGKKFSSGTQLGSREEFSSLSFGITKTTSLGPMLVGQPATEPLFVHKLVYILYSGLIKLRHQRKCLLEHHGLFKLWCQIFFSPLYDARS